MTSESPEEKVSAERQVDKNSDLERRLHEKIGEVADRYRQLSPEKLLECLNSSTLFQKLQHLKKSLFDVLEADPSFNKIPAQIKKAICGDFVLIHFPQVLEAVNETLAGTDSAPDARTLSKFTELIVARQPVLYNDPEQGFEKRKAQYLVQFIEKFGVLPKKSLGEHYQFDDWIREQWGERQDNGTLNSKLISVTDPDLLQAGYDFIDAMSLRFSRAQKAGKDVTRRYAKLKDCLRAYQCSSEKKRIFIEVINAGASTSRNSGYKTFQAKTS